MSVSPAPSVAASSRRTAALLAVVVVAVVVVATAAGVLLLPVTPAPPPCPLPGSAPTARSPIQHVFFLIKENHAFENYFGDLPGVIGYPPNGTFPAAFGSNATVSPFPLGVDSTPDLPHDRASELVDLDGGRNDRFVAEAAADGYSDAKDAVGYYTASQIPDYYAYAHYYTLDDMFFSGILGPTLPNRLFDLGLTGTNWTSDLPPSASAVSGPTFPGQLAAAGLPWDYFYSGSSFALPTTFVPQIAGNACLSSHVLPVGDLHAALAGTDPPAFAYIDPENDPLYSEHPPTNVTLGEEWTAAVVNEIFESPIGNTSAVFLFYDEAGGFWDPVAPPTEPPLGDGFRVPLLVLSPWSAAGAITHAVNDPANLLHWVEANWGLSPLNGRIGAAPAPTTLFNFSAPARAPLILPTPVSLAPIGGIAHAASHRNGPRLPGGGPSRALLGVEDAALVRSCEVMVPSLESRPRGRSGRSRTKRGSVATGRTERGCPPGRARRRSTSHPARGSARSRRIARLFRHD